MKAATRLRLEAYATEPMRIAAELEEMLIEEPMDQEVAIELAVLYFKAQDFGFSAHLHLPWDWVNWTGDRLFELLVLASSRFPGSSEVVVWDAYIRLILEGKDEDLFLRTLELVRQRGDSELPCVFLYYRAGVREDDRRRAQAVYERVRGRRTPSESYLASILEPDFGATGPVGTSRTT